LPLLEKSGKSQGISCLESGHPDYIKSTFQGYYATSTNVLQIGTAGMLPLPGRRFVFIHEVAAQHFDE